MTQENILPDTTNNPQANFFVWPCHWGGVTRSNVPPLIHGKLRELRLAVGGIAAKKQAGGPMFPVRGAKELAQKLAQALCDLDLIAPVIAQEVTLVPTEHIPSNATQSGKPVFRTLAHVKATVRVGAADGSYVDMVGSGHGGDVDDKAGGKADTYAWKIAILKGLTIPEQDMLDTDDESSDSREADAKPEKPAKADAKTVNKLKVEAPPGESRLAEALARVEAATKETMESIAEALKVDIQAGTLPLAGADKLRLGAAVRAKRESFNAPNPSK